MNGDKTKERNIELAYVDAAIDNCVNNMHDINDILARDAKVNFSYEDYVNDYIEQVCILNHLVKAKPYITEQI